MQQQENMEIKSPVQPSGNFHQYFERIKNSLLKKHYLNHNGKILRLKPFSCKFCEGCFKTEYALKQHAMARHEELYEEKQYWCLKCNRCWKMYSDQQNHMFSKHKRLNCGICKKEIHRKDAAVVKNPTGKIKVCVECFPFGNHEQALTTKVSEKPLVPHLATAVCTNAVTEKQAESHKLENEWENVVPEEEMISEMHVESSYGAVNFASEQNKSYPGLEEINMEISKVSGLSNKNENQVESVPPISKKVILEGKLKKLAETYGSANVTVLDSLMSFEENNSWTLTYHSDALESPHKCRITKSPIDYHGGYAEYAEYILKIIESFGEFFKELEAKYAQFKKATESIEIELLVNFKKEVMATVKFSFDCKMFHDELKNLELKHANSWNIKSLFYETPSSRKRNKIAGPLMLTEYIEHLQVSVDHASSIGFRKTQISMKVIQHFLQPSFRDTILDIGCGNGLRALFLSNQCEQIIGIGCDGELGNARHLKVQNKVENVTFREYSMSLFDFILEKSQLWNNVLAVIDCTATFCQSPTIGVVLRSVTSLNRLVLLLPLDQIDSLLLKSLIKPLGKLRNDHFIVKKVRAVDFEQEILCIFLLERMK